MRGEEVSRGMGFPNYYAVEPSPAFPHGKKKVII